MKLHQMPVDSRMKKRLGAISPDVKQILEHPEFRKLRGFPRHGYTNTHDHSLRVADMASRLAGKMGVDKESAVRVGLLHDMCFVSYYRNRRIPKKERHPGLYAFYHPEEAAENAKKFGLDRKELDAIRAHMFPLAVHLPKNRLALVLTLCDKKISAQECFYSFCRKIRLKMSEKK